MEYAARGLQPGSVSAGLARAWNQDAGSAAAQTRMIGEGVQDAGDCGVSGKNPYYNDGDGGQRNSEGNQQGAQVRPTFL